jgi:hypothetical protein
MNGQKWRMNPCIIPYTYWLEPVSSQGHGFGWFCEGSNVGSNLYDPTFLSKIWANCRQMFCWKSTRNSLSQFLSSNKGTRHFFRRLNFSKSAGKPEIVSNSRFKHFLDTINLRVRNSVIAIEKTNFFSHFSYTGESSRILAGMLHHKYGI